MRPPLKFSFPFIPAAARKGRVIDKGEVVIEVESGTMYYGDGTTRGGVEVGKGSEIIKQLEAGQITLGGLSELAYKDKIDLTTDLVLSKKLPLGFAPDDTLNENVDEGFIKQKMSWDESPSSGATKNTYISGEGVPSNSLGDNGDLYTDTSDGNQLYTKINGVWLKGKSGEDAVLYTLIVDPQVLFLRSGAEQYVPESINISAKKISQDGVITNVPVWFKIYKNDNVFYTSSIAESGRTLGISYAESLDKLVVEMYKDSGFTQLLDNETIPIIKETGKLNIVLSNDNVGVACDPLGNIKNGSLSFSYAYINVYDGVKRLDYEAGTTSVKGKFSVSIEESIGVTVGNITEHNDGKTCYITNHTNLTQDNAIVKYRVQGTNVDGFAIDTIVEQKLFKIYDGIGVSNVTKNGETLTISYSDGGSDDFTVLNGTNGSDGVDGSSVTVGNITTDASGNTVVQLLDDDGSELSTFTVPKGDGIESVTSTKTGLVTTVKVKYDNGTPDYTFDVTDGMSPPDKFTWVKYADSPTTGMSDDPTGKAYIGLAYNKGSETESTNYNDYNWSLIKGISSISEKYGLSNSVSSQPSTWSSTPQTITPINKYLWNKRITEYNDNTTSETAPAIIGTYGIGISSITNYYKITNSDTPPVGGWTTTPTQPTVMEQYLWNYEETTFEDGSTSNSPATIIAVYSADGVGISSVVEEYAVTTTTTPPTSGWSTSSPTMSAVNKYLWNRETINYTDNSSTTSDPLLIGVYGDKGDQGDQGDSTFTYYQTNTPSSPKVNELWYNPSLKEIKRYNGSGWDVVGNNAKTTTWIDTMEYASAEDFINGWVNYGGSPTFDLTSDSYSGGRSLIIGDNSGDDEGWLISKQLFEYNPDKLYRIRCTVKKTAGSGTAYIGVAGVRADGVTLVNMNGDSRPGSQHYIGAVDVDIPTSWTTYTGYISGRSVGGVTNNTAQAPKGLHPNAKFFRPLVLVNYSHQSGMTYIDSYSVEEIGNLADLGYTGDTNATFGAKAGENLLDNDGNPLADPDIKNSSIDIVKSGKSFTLNGVNGTNIITLNADDVGAETPAGATAKANTAQDNAEKNVKSAFTGTNLAIGAVITGSTTVTNSTRLNDGVKAISDMYWSCGSGTQWIQYDIGSVKFIAESRVFFYNLDNRTYRYKIAYSEDGTNWEYAIGTSSNYVMSRDSIEGYNPSGVIFPTIDSINGFARYVRLYMNGNTTNTGNHGYEWELLSAGGKLDPYPESYGSYVKDLVNTAQSTADSKWTLDEELINSLAEAKAELAVQTANAYADGIITEEERAILTNYENKVADIENAIATAKTDAMKASWHYVGNWTVPVNDDVGVSFDFPKMLEDYRDYARLAVLGNDFEGSIRLYVNGNQITPNFTGANETTYWFVMDIPNAYLNTSSDNTIRFANYVSDNDDGAIIYQVQIIIDQKAMANKYTDDKAGYLISNPIANAAETANWSQVASKPSDPEIYNNQVKLVQNGNNFTLSGGGTGGTISKDNLGVTDANYKNSNTTDNDVQGIGITTGGFLNTEILADMITPTDPNIGEFSFARASNIVFKHPNGNIYTINDYEGITSHLEGIGSGDSGIFFVVFVGSDTSRINNSYNKSVVVCRKVGTQWQYSNNTSFANFTPNENDCILLKFQRDKTIHEGVGDITNVYYNAVPNDYEATKNQSDTITNNAIDDASKTAEWSEVSGVGKPADGADVTAPTIGCKINTMNWNQSQVGEIYIHGYNSNGEPADIDGYVWISGTKRYIPRNAMDGWTIGTQMVGKGLIVFDFLNNSFTVASTAMKTAFVKKVNNRFYYDPNGDWTEFIPTQSMYIIGEMETDDTDSVKSASMFPHPMLLANFTDPNADKTSENRAASIINQGDFATMSELGLDDSRLTGTLSVDKAHEDLRNSKIIDGTSQLTLTQHNNDGNWNNTYVDENGQLQGVSEGVGTPVKNDLVQNYLESIKGKQLLKNDWTIGSGSVGMYNQNGNTTENYRVYGVNPCGHKDIIWECRPDSTSGADGGWNTSSFPIDKTRTYRFSVFVKTSKNTGTTYFGVGANTVCILETTATHSNPYFWNGDLPEQNKWYLLVSYVFPYGQTGYSNVGEIIDCTTGKTVSSGLWCYNWANVTTSFHRCYLYYCTDTANRQWMWHPRVDLVDGNEPSVIDLVGFVSADKIRAGLLQSLNWGTTAGSRFDLDNGTFELGGSGDNAKLKWDGSTLGVSGRVSANKILEFDYSTGANGIRFLASTTSSEYPVTLLATRNYNTIDGYYTSLNLVGGGGGYPLLRVRGDEFNINNFDKININVDKVDLSSTDVSLQNGNNNDDVVYLSISSGNMEITTSNDGNIRATLQTSSDGFHIGGTIKPVHMEGLGVLQNLDLGDSTYPINTGYFTTLYENNTKLSDKYLGKTAKAADSDKLDGLDSSAFIKEVNGNYYTNKSIAMVENASPQWVLLCGYGTNNNVHGRFQVTRTSGYYQSAIIDVVVTSGSSMTTVGGTLKTLQVTHSSEDYRLVKVTYNSIDYIAIKYSGSGYPQTDGLRFTGFLQSTQPAMITVSTGVTNETAFTNKSEAYYDVDNVFMKQNLSVGGDLTENGTKLSDKYLGKTAKAADSDKLDGLDSSDFLRSVTDSEQVGDFGLINWNEGTTKINSDPRVNAAGYDGDSVNVHWWATKADGSNYGRAGHALYNGSAYQYLHTKASQNHLYHNNSIIYTSANLSSSWITATAVNSWVHHSGRPVKYRKFADCIQIIGTLERSDYYNGLAFTLASGYRPNRTHVFAVHCNRVNTTWQTYMYVNADGTSGFWDVPGGGAVNIDINILIPITM
jgi:hypothetical protein